MVTVNTLLGLMVALYTGMMFLDGSVTNWEFFGAWLFGLTVFYIAIVYDTWPPEANTP